jgi:hypothetical protein
LFETFRKVKEFVSSTGTIPEIINNEWIFIIYINNRLHTTDQNT